MFQRVEYLPYNYENIVGIPNTHNKKWYMAIHVYNLVLERKVMEEDC